MNCRMKLIAQQFTPVLFGIFLCISLNGMDTEDAFNTPDIPTVDHQVAAISRDLREFNVLLDQQAAPTLSLSKKEKKAHSRPFNVVTLGAVVGALGYFVKLNPPETISRAHSRTRTMGIVEGAAVLSPLLAPLGTAISVAFLWYKFNNLLHYQCKTERERDVQAITAIATQNKTELQEAFDNYRKNIDQSLTTISQNTKTQIEQSHKENRQQMEAYKKVMDDALEEIATNLTTVQQELQTTTQTNSQLKEKFENKALPLLQKIGIEIGDLKKQTIQPLSKTTPQAKKKTDNHQRKNSGIICILTHHHSRELSWHAIGNTKKKPTRLVTSGEKDEKSDTED